MQENCSLSMLIIVVAFVPYTLVHLVHCTAKLIFLFNPPFTHIYCNTCCIYIVHIVFDFFLELVLKLCPFVN